MWIDRWELNVGDSLIQKIQDAVGGASALIVVLTKASVSSEWCRKELNAGLLRELEEKRVIVLPLLVEDCEIPLFLREKKYADFRSSFDEGLRDVLKAIAKITNSSRARVEAPEWHVDWAIDWGREAGFASYILTFVEQAVGQPYSCLTTIHVRGNEAATRRYDLYKKEGLEWVYHNVIVQTLADAAKEMDLRMVLGDALPTRREFGVKDPRLGIEWSAEVQSRLLGEDTGSDVLLDIASQLLGTAEHMREIARKPTDAEYLRLRQILETLP